MADKNRLGLLGCLLAGATFGAVLMAFLAVRGHVQGSMVFDEVAAGPPLASLSGQ